MTQRPVQFALLLLCLGCMARLGHAHSEHASPTSHEYSTGNTATIADTTELRPAHGMQIHDCWIRAMPSKLPSAAYFRIENAGNHSQVLLAVRSPQFGRVMLHTTDDTGTMRMAASLEIPAKANLVFAPRGNHVMLEQPLRPLTPGDSVSLTFRFEGNRAMTIQCLAKPANTLQ